MQPLLHDLPNPGNLAHIERREKIYLTAGHNPQHPIRLRLIGADLGYQPRCSDSNGAVQLGLGFHQVMQRMGGTHRRTMQALGSGHVDVRFVDGDHLQLRRKAIQHLVHLGGVVAIALRMPIDEDRLRAELGCRTQRHRRVNSELPRRIGRGRYHPALVPLAADHNRLSLQRRIE